MRNPPCGSSWRSRQVKCRPLLDSRARLSSARIDPSVSSLVNASSATVSLIPTASARGHSNRRRQSRTQRQRELFHTAPRVGGQRLAQQHLHQCDRDDDQRDEDHGLCVRHAPHGAPPSEIPTGAFGGCSQPSFVSTRPARHRARGPAFGVPRAVRRPYSAPGAGLQETAHRRPRAAICRAIIAAVPAA